MDRVSVELYCMSNDNVFAFGVYPIKDGKVVDEEIGSFEVDVNGTVYANYEEEKDRVFDTNSSVKLSEVRTLAMQHGIFDIAEKYANEHF